jgi:hypothetical protein
MDYGLRADNKIIQVPLKKNDLGVFNTIAVLVLILSYLSFLYRAIILRLLPDIIIIVLLASILGTVYFRISKGVYGYKYGYLIFLLTGAIWFYQGGTASFAIGILVMVAGFFQIQLKETPTVTAADSGITVKNVFSKHYPWAELNNVVIKDGLLTIDCKNNRLLQKETSLDITARYEAKFNEFCILKVHGR